MDEHKGGVCLWKTARDMIIRFARHAVSCDTLPQSFQFVSLLCVLVRSFVASVSVVVRLGHSRLAQDHQFFFSNSFFWEEGVRSFLFDGEGGGVFFLGGSPFFSVFLSLRLFGVLESICFSVFFVLFVLFFLDSSLFSLDSSLCVYF